MWKFQKICHIHVQVYLLLSKIVIDIQKNKSFIINFTFFNLLLTYEHEQI